MPHSQTIAQHATRRFERKDALAVRTLLTLAGDLILVLGAVLAISGLLAHPAPYYVLAGAGLISSGYLIARRRWEGAFVYMAVFALTVAFSLCNVEHGGTPLAMRLVGPLTLLAMIALLMPALRGWRVRRTIIAFSAVMSGTIGIAVGSITDGPFAAPTAAAVHLLDVQTIRSN